MKKIRYVVLAFLTAIALISTGCKTEVETDTIAPADITGLAVTAVNGNAVLTWTNPTDADFAGVKITMTPSAGTLVSSVMVENEVNTFTVSGLTNGNEYTFKIQAFDNSLNFAKGESEGATAKGTPLDTSDKTPPAEVTGLTVNNAINGNAVLTWTNSTDDDFAGVKITMTPAIGTLAVPVILCKEASTFTVSGLTNGTEYFFTVQSFDNNLNFSTGESEGATAKATPQDTSDKTPPAEVTGLTVTAVNGNAILTWTNPTDDDFTGVKITMTPAEGTLANPVTLDKGVNTFTVTSLTNGTEYNFKVQSFDTSLNFATGESEGATAKATPQDTSDKVAPSDITGLAVTASDGNAILTWTNPTDEDFAGVKITMTPTSGTLASTVTLGKGVNTFTVTGLTNGTEYNFKVQSFDTSLNFATGETEVATPLDTSDKTAPEVVIHLSVSCVNGTDGKVNAVLTWTDPGDSDLFGIEVTYEENTSSRVALAPMTKKSIFVGPGNGGTVINDLIAGKTYTFTVKTMDTSGNKSEGVSEKATMSLSQLSELKITLTPSTKEITNKDVTVSVKAESSSAVSKICYVTGIKTSVDDVLKGTDITSSASFTAIVNGTYTVAAVDYDGRRELSYITIDNIDKTAPNAPTNLAASYNYGKKTITLTWNSSDSDVDYYLVSYTKAGSTVKTNEKVTKKTYTVSDVEVGATEETYEFTVKAVDKAGNASNESEATVTPKRGPIVSKIELSRNHFAYTEAGTTFTATVYGSNFNLISIQDDTTLKVQIVDSNSNITNAESTIDVSNNTATAILTLPTLTSATTTGTNFTVRAKICGEVDSDHTTTFNISDVANVTSVSLETNQISVNDVTSGMKTKATVKGTNLDVAGIISIVLYDSTNTQYGDSVIVDTSSFSQNTTNFDVDVPIPTVDDTYNVRLLFSDVVQNKTTDLQVYGVPSFTSFKIPKAGISKEDNTVTATVVGKNFKAPGVIESDFSLGCATKSIVTDSKIKIVNDSRLKVTLTIPGTAEDYEVKIVSGNKSLTGTFTVKDYSTYAVGDILLKNGSKVDVKDIGTYSIDADNPPVAIVTGFNTNGAALGIGLQRGSNLAWAKSGTVGYKTSFTDIIAIVTSGNEKDGYTFSGDLDGSDNWEVICLTDPIGTFSENIAINYPAFEFAENYGSNQGYTGELANGWYIPTIAELYEVYKNKDILQKSLTKAGGFSIGIDRYWSSSQNGGMNSHSYTLVFSGPYFWEELKYSDKYKYVLVFRKF